MSVQLLGTGAQTCFKSTRWVRTACDGLEMQVLLTCVNLHFEYASMLQDPYTPSRMFKSVQMFTCKVYMLGIT